MDRAQVTTTEHDQVELPPYTRYFFSRPTSSSTPARVGPTYQVQVSDPSQIPHILLAASRSHILALDTETKGTDYSETCTCDGDLGIETCRSTHIIGIGLSWDTGSCYLPWSEMPRTDKESVLDMVYQHPGLIAHNVYFDGGVLIRETGSWIYPWYACTLALYHLLSNEGWAGQKYGLKEIMTEVLGWSSSNEEGIDTWLVSHGYYKGGQRVETDPDKLVAEYLAGGLKPDKAEMWRVPHDILGQYCVLDAEATYLFFTEHLEPVTRKFPLFWDNFCSDWMYMLVKHIEQRLTGILMDRKAIEARRKTLLGYMVDLERDFLGHPEVAEHIRDIESEMRQALAAKEPERYKQLSVAPEEPSYLKKDGTPSKNWIRWKALVDSGKYSTPQPSKVWESWSERWAAAVRGELPKYRFNIQSKIQLAELLYRRVGYPVHILTEKEAPGTGADALAQMGELGRILINRDDALKEVGFLDKYLELMVGRETIHPSFSIPGTSTGRLSSKEPNLQQVKKTTAMMDLFVARPGHTWIDLDFHALEPTVTTEFSRDPNMEAIYGEGARKNDIYLFVAYSVPQWQGALKATGYDPYFPTEEGLVRAKKECKHIRKVAKVVVLACAYGAGVDKIHENLTNDGMDISKDEVKEVHEGYWKLFETVKKYGYDLQDLWWETVQISEAVREQYKDWSRSRYKRDKIPRNLVGYIVNGMQRPMCVTYDYKKDALNRFIQSTGHDILVRYIRMVGQALDAQAIPWSPIVVNWHDSMAIEVPDQYVQATIETYKIELEELNRQLGGRIRLKGTPSYGKNMTAIKEPEV